MSTVSGENCLFLSFGYEPWKKDHQNPASVRCAAHKNYKPKNVSKAGSMLLAQRLSIACTVLFPGGKQSTGGKAGELCPFWFKYREVLILLCSPTSLELSISIACCKLVKRLFLEP